MAAPLGFKDFVTGEVLTAADVDGYLMQGIWVFASATARDAAVTSPQEGNFAYLKDTNVTTYYTGSAWTNLDTTGMVNPMTTTGDTIYSSSGSTPARLGIGSTGNVLTVAGGVPTWAAPAGGGKVLQVVSAVTSTETQVTTTTFTDSSLTCSITPTSSSSKILVLTSQVFGIGQSNDNAFTAAALILLRGSTTVYRPGSSSNYEWSQGITRKFTNPIVYLDSPATTSSITYKTQIKLLGTPAGASVTAQSGTAESSIVLMEIGA
jgi:hypothetical protein